MSDEKRTVSDRDENQRAAYQQLCNSYHEIDNFRAKLLGFLPLASGAGIFLLLNDAFTDSTKLDFNKQFLGPIGLFGFVVTLGLFCYELHGIKKCGHLINAGEDIEKELDIKGPFTDRPRDVAGFINEPFAAGIIYPAVLAAWMYSALVFTLPQAVPLAAILVFIVGFAGSLIYDLLLRKGR